MLEQALDRHHDRLSQCGQIWIAYSGGVDSHALLLACSRLRFQSGGPKLCAVHIHHGLLPDADRWSRHCESTAQALGVPFRLIRVNARDTDGLGPERAAREARYQAFLALMQAGDCLLTAHHQDDQAETLLLQMFRGAGVAGLAAMPEVNRFGGGVHVRPLLGVSRDDIVRFARNARLHWIEDHSNQDQSLDRNYVRHSLIPLIQARWPAFNSNAARSAKLCGETYDWMHAYATERLRDQALDRLDLTILAQETPFIRRLLMREWLRRAGIKMPAYRVMEQIVAQFVEARDDSEPRCRLRQHELRRFQNHVYLLPHLPDQCPAYDIPWTTGDCSLPKDLGTLTMTIRPGKGVDHRLWQQAKVMVRSRLGGERIRLAGSTHHKRLKHWFQEHNIPPWLRERMPLIFLDEELVAIGDLWVDTAYSASDNEPGVCIEWQTSQADKQT